MVCGGFVCVCASPAPKYLGYWYETHLEHGLYNTRIPSLVNQVLLISLGAITLFEISNFTCFLELLL